MFTDIRNAEQIDSKPKISIMIPTYEPNLDYLEQTLESVLNQDISQAEIQIEVVDDASVKSRPDRIIAELGKNLVQLVRNPKNLGLVQNWNNCIMRAKGDWVHILHQDDYVLPGFYESLIPGMMQDKVGLVFCRHNILKTDGSILISDLESDTPGCIKDFLFRIGKRQRIQFAAAIVRKLAYMESGLFNLSFCFAGDWEMWVRLAARYEVWFEPKILACYRIHEASSAWTLAKAGLLPEDHLRVIKRIAEYLPMEKKEEITTHAFSAASTYGIMLGDQIIKSGSTRAGILCAWKSFLMYPKVTSLKRIAKVISGAVLFVLKKQLRTIKYIKSCSN